MVQLPRKLCDITRNRVSLMRSLLFLSLFVSCLFFLILLFVVRLLGALGLRVETDHRELYVLVVRR